MKKIVIALLQEPFGFAIPRGVFWLLNVLENLLGNLVKTIVRTQKILKLLLHFWYNHIYGDTNIYT